MGEGMGERVPGSTGAIGFALGAEGRGPAVPAAGSTVPSPVEALGDSVVRDLVAEVRTAETLRRVGSALVAELDLDRVVEIMVGTTRDLTGAEVGRFHFHPDDARRDPLLPGLLAPGLVETTFGGDTVVLGGTVVRGDDPAGEPRAGDRPAPPDPVEPEGGIRSYLAVPVVSGRGGVLGGLFLGHSTPGAFTAEHERLVAGIAAPAAIAIDNARLYQAARRDREAAHRLAGRLTQMQAVSARLAGARVVDEVAEVVVSGVARALGCDRASLYTVEPDGQTLCLLRSFGYEGRFWDRWRLIDRRAALPASDALRDRRVVLLRDQSQWTERYPEVAEVADRSVALAVLPLALGEQAFGVAAFGWDRPRAFEQDEVQFLDALADQCSQALERARLYEVERETARVLQRSLLPARDPEIPGMDVAGRYRAGDRSVAVGGDFYDVFRTGANRWGIALGDVCGRGAAAAARTALVRYTVRAVASRGERPVEVLRDLNRAVVAEPEADDRFCAAVVGQVELDRCGAWVTLACAGHPRPYVVRRAGWIDLRGQPGALLGLFDDVEPTEDRVGLGPGDSLVLFTDGITEARNGAGEHFADEELPLTLLAGTQLGAAELAERVRQAAVAFSGGKLGDDVAVLVVRVPPQAEDDPDGRLASALGDAAAAPGYPVPDGGSAVRPLPPREARILLPPEPTSPRAARRFLVGVLASWRMPELLEGDAALLLSELATNAILHARSGFTVIARYDGSHLRVEVGDGSRAEPRVRLVESHDTPGGRGLVLIDAVASRWGILPTARGKRVWFELPVPPTRLFA